MLTLSDFGLSEVVLLQKKNKVSTQCRLRSRSPGTEHAAQIDNAALRHFPDKTKDDSC